MSAAVQKAVEARIREGAGMADRVFDTARIDAKGGLIRDNYTVVGVSLAGLDEGRLSAAHRADSPGEYFIDVRGVGTTSDAARLMLDRAKTQLLSARLSAPKLRFQQVAFERETKIETDMSVTPPLFYADAEYTVRSDRA